MKRLLLLFTLAFVAMSCEELQDFIDTKGHGLVFLEGEMKAYFPDNGDTKNYKFNADLAWSATVSAEWVEVDPASGEAGENKIQIKVDKNKSNERRTGYVDITLSNDKSYRIELVQLATSESLDDITPSVSIPNNEIWYTSADGNIVEPYSGEASQDNFAVFGANIVSNTFDAEKECWVIKFDGDVTSVGSFAFYECSSIVNMTIPESVTSIGYAAFYNCSSLTSITIPDGVTTIGGWAFGYCSSITSVTIPDSVTSIGYAAFYNCSSLTSITIPDSVTAIGGYAFNGCSSLISITIPDNVTTIEGYAFFECSSLTSVTIPDSLTSIGDSAFSLCSSLTSVTIGDSVTAIGECAFWVCSSLTSVTIPDSVTTIGDAAFARCSNLREFNGKYVSKDGRCLIFNGTLNSFAPAGLTEYTIPDGVTNIGQNAFDWCSSLTSITIGDGVTTIGTWAFGDCSSLTSVTIPDSVTTIDVNAFCNCSGLTSVTIPDSVTTIGYGVFVNCSSLTSVTISNSVTTIGEAAFAWCECLTSVYCKAVIPPTVNIFDGDWSAFYNNAPDRKIYVPTESVEVYKSATGWSDYADAIVGYDF